MAEEAGGRAVRVGVQQASHAASTSFFMFSLLLMSRDFLKHPARARMSPAAVDLERTPFSRESKCLGTRVPTGPREGSRSSTSDVFGAGFASFDTYKNIPGPCP